MRRSLRLRLIVWMIALLLPASAAAGWLLVRVFANRLVRDIDVALTEEAETVAALLAKPEGGVMMETLLQHISEELDLGPGKQVAVRRGATIIGESPPGAAAFLSSHTPTDDLRMVTRTAGPPDDPTTIQIGVPASTAVNLTRRLTFILIVGIPCTVLLLAAGQWMVIGRALGPLETAAQKMEAVGVADLTTRVPTPRDNDEVGRMVLALNRMLDRVARSVEQMQRFTADAAHELRTPLTVLRTGLEITLTRERTPAEYRAALGDALQATERLTRLAEDLLALARLDAGMVPASEMAPVDVTELLQDLADAWRSRASELAVDFDLAPTPGLTIQGRLADLYRLLNNLIDNALRHSPAGGVVSLDSRRDEESVRISISDDGPGIAPGEEQKLLDRFYRGRGEKTGGSGLGLSIADMIARAHGGEIRLANRAAGGCVATLTLPRVPAVHAVAASDLKRRRVTD